MNYPIFRLDNIDNKVKENFKKKTKEIIKTCNESLKKLKQEETQLEDKILEIYSEIEYKINNKIDIDNLRELQIKEYNINSELTEIKMMMYNIKKNKEKYQYISKHYEDIKFVFNKYDNNDTIENNITKT
jgi:hypothetical protein